jgi:hypothetical protein
MRPTKPLFIRLILIPPFPPNQFGDIQRAFLFVETSFCFPFTSLKDFKPIQILSQQVTIFYVSDKCSVKGQNRKLKRRLRPRLRLGLR